MTHHLKNYRAGHKKQSGVTLMGLLVVSALLIFFALLGMKIVPPYMEFLSVQKVLKSMQQEPLDTMSTSDIRKSFDKRASVAYISVIKGADLSVEKSTAGTVITVDYQVIEPIAGNLSVLIDFSARSDSK